ncbi:MAG: hypothetical protein DID92_2727743989 [Candidatus Nitrotoga sp. SPKER]|nr:MAG: hypothetical protein DID92_2727743989 [Candidatus Nitrotoga sp. SPKER]
MQAFRSVFTAKIKSKLIESNGELVTLTMLADIGDIVDSWNVFYITLDFAERLMEKSWKEGRLNNQLQHLNLYKVLQLVIEPAQYQIGVGK